MKKSEALTLIEESIRPCNCTYKAHRERAAIRILEVLLEAGMLPPDNWYIDNRFNNEWEDE